MAPELKTYNEKPKNDKEYFSHIIRATFVVGFSREVINSKWEGFEKIFDKFDFNIVAKWGSDEIQEASESKEIIRNFRKINATVENAKKVVELISQFGSIHDFIRSFDGLDHDERLKRIAKEFNFFGPTAANIFLYLSGEPVVHIEEIKSK